MKKYIVLETQEGGCDYTIGCGKNWEFIEAETIGDAIEKYLYDEEGLRSFGEDETTADAFSIYEIGESLDEEECMKIHELRLNIKNEKISEEDERQQVEDEKKQLETLKEKYES